MDLVVRYSKDAGTGKYQSSEGYLRQDNQGLMSMYGKHHQHIDYQVLRTWWNFKL